MIRKRQLVPGIVVLVGSIPHIQWVIVKWAVSSVNHLLDTSYNTWLNKKDSQLMDYDHPLSSSPKYWVYKKNTWHQPTPGNAVSWWLGSYARHVSLIWQDMAHLLQIHPPVLLQFFQSLCDLLLLRLPLRLQGVATRVERGLTCLATGRCLWMKNDKSHYNI